MREKWINIGLEDEELKPYLECPSDVLDPVRIGNLCQSPCHALYSHMLLSSGLIQTSSCKNTQIAVETMIGVFISQFFLLMDKQNTKVGSF